MGGIIGGQKTGGRIPGTPNRRTFDASKIAEELGGDPFQILMHFAMNKWKELGYESEKKEILSAKGSICKVDRISEADRINAAKEACKYLYPQRKAIDHTSGGESIESSLAMLLARDVSKE